MTDTAHDKMGRPALPDGEARTEMLALRVAPDERRRIEDRWRAEASPLSMSEWMRTRLLGDDDGEDAPTAVTVPPPMSSDPEWEAAIEGFFDELGSLPAQDQNLLLERLAATVLEMRPGGGYVSTTTAIGAVIDSFVKYIYAQRSGGPDVTETSESKP